MTKVRTKAKVSQEIANLEGSHDDLQKEIKSLKVHLDERDEVIVELYGAVEFLTNKRCWCNNDKVSPCYWLLLTGSLWDPVSN